MIDYARSAELNKWSIDELKAWFKKYPGSGKKIVAVCDGCGKERIVKFQNYYDLCRKCACNTEENIRKITLFGVDNPRYGKHQSPETRKKTSEALKGRTHSKERRFKNSMCHRRENLSDKARKNMSEAHKGKIPSSETRKKTSESMKGRHAGDKNPAWKGGISFGKYCYLFTETFKEKIRKFFNRRCFLCGMTEEENGRKLDVHHVNYDKDCLCNARCEFVPLCRHHHLKTNFNRKYWEDLIMCYLYPNRIEMIDI